MTETVFGTSASDCAYEPRKTKTGKCTLKQNTTLANKKLLSLLKKKIV